MRQYFEAEMRLLHEAGQKFARAYPEQAGLLNFQQHVDPDPHIERLLEGVAFLTAQIKQRIDDDLPDISANLLLQLWPQILQPFPSVTIVEFTSRPGQLTKALKLPKNTLLRSQPLGDEKTSCQFSTSAPVIINPIHLSDLFFSESVQGGTIVKLDFQCDHNITIDNLDLSHLQFYIDATPTLGLEIYRMLTADVKEIRVLMPDKVVLGDQRNCVGCYLASDETLLPICDRSFYGYYLLQEYFVCREKYLFVKLLGLEKISWSKALKKFSIEILCKTNLLNDINIDKNYLKLHCVPAINLYQQTSEPIIYNTQRVDYPVTTDSRRIESIILHSIDEIDGIDVTTGERYSYDTLYNFKHRRDRSGFFQVVFRDEGGEFPRPYIMLGGEEKFKKIDLSCQITVSNGHYPRRYLREGMLNQIINGPNYLAVSNITRPTLLLLPPKRKQYLWQLISCLALNVQHLTKINTLNDLLNMFNWSERQEHQMRIDAIKQVDSVICEKISNGCFIRGIEFRLVIHEDGFRSRADIYLFGQILQHFLSMHIAINYFVQLKICCHPSQQIFFWESLLGQQMPI